MSNPIVDLEDEAFLSEVAAAELQALSSSTATATATSPAAKRLRVSATTDNTSVKDDVGEGAYIAALKGSKSLFFQQQSTFPSVSSNNAVGSSTGSLSSAGSGGSCFKCGKLGHWSRDCDADFARSVDGSEPEKLCPCGLGNCIVLTANTEKNRGRKFFRCPVRQENGGCGFFEWRDQISGSESSTPSSQNYSLNASYPELSCPCGAGSCLILTAKRGTNIGQQFYRCPANQGSCGFFKWCNDHTTTTHLSNSANASQPQVYQSSNSAVSQRSYDSGSSSCYKCGKQGHWAKDCLPDAMNSTGNGGVNGTAKSNCFKCGRPGHWAKDCPSAGNHT